MLAHFYYKWGRKWWSRLLAYTVDIRYTSGRLPTVYDSNDIHTRLQKIKWTRDKFNDYVQLPIVTWNKRTGDCEDFAKLGMVLLRDLDIRSHMLSVRYKGGGHAVCVFRENGRLKYFDNNRYCIMKRDDTIYDIINAISRGKFEFYALTDIDDRLISFKRRLP